MFTHRVFRIMFDQDSRFAFLSLAETDKMTDDEVLNWLKEKVPSEYSSSTGIERMGKYLDESRDLSMDESHV